MEGVRDERVVYTQWKNRKFEGSTSAPALKEGNQSTIFIHFLNSSPSLPSLFLPLLSSSVLHHGILWRVVGIVTSDWFRGENEKEIDERGSGLDFKVWLLSL